ncbi:conserved hypothetical protein [Catenulispora acidiphila DSM 44928]|uniref:NsdA n=1 Tax=Catenulispora acidiphila (strain DSM 44928 / JCM 14897 / NBRC 102108 / NRRL B-24433 / ID139908) TaxID=479433 RepID=C7QGX4_CATAD|nr:hypothetical protein [Catenulispora acidiphila]ACU76824.1 conserved hypothetical protein [Catenulispora acidiphila DSM 44928]
MTGKPPNELLNSWFQRSGWSKGELARLVNKRARQLGAAHVSTDTSRVRRWLDGEHPRDPAPRILVELFSERFGTVITHAELGLREPAAPPATSGVDLPWAGRRSIELLGDFARSDLMLNRRGFLGTSLSLSAGPSLIEPMKRWLSPVPEQHSVNGRLPGRVTAEEMDRLEETTRLFRGWDAQCGGGLRRMAVVGQLHEVTELLRDNYAPALSERLFRTAAELALLAGWMAYDIGMQPSAQRYFVLALHAAREAGDTPLGALVLATMSRQMIHINRPQDALELVHLAQYGSHGTTTARVQSLLAAMEARAYANLGDSDNCRRAVAAAEDLFPGDFPAGQDRAERGSNGAGGDRTRGGDPSWIAFFTEAELYGENGHSFRDLAYRYPQLTEQAAKNIDRAVELLSADDSYLRSRALNVVGMATVRLQQREPEAAVAYLHGGAELVQRLRSKRVEDRLRTTAGNLFARYPDVRSVREVHERTLAVLPAAA